MARPPPGLLQRAFIIPARADAASGWSLQQALRRWGSPEVDDEAAEAAAKAAEDEFSCKLLEAARSAEQAVAASAALEQAQVSLKEAMRLAGNEAAITVAREAQRQGLGFEEARRGSRLSTSAAFAAQQPMAFVAHVFLLAPLRRSRSAEARATVCSSTPMASPRALACTSARRNVSLHHPLQVLGAAVGAPAALAPSGRGVSESILL